jgi:hypothetical protein
VVCGARLSSGFGVRGKTGRFPCMTTRSVTRRRLRLPVIRRVKISREGYRPSPSVWRRFHELLNVGYSCRTIRLFPSSGACFASPKKRHFRDDVQQRSRNKAGRCRPIIARKKTPLVRKRLFYRRHPTFGQVKEDLSRLDRLQTALLLSQISIHLALDRFHNDSSETVKL